MKKTDTPMRHARMRQGQTLAMARQADDSLPRPTHGDLARRYGVKAHGVPATVQLQVPAFD